MAGNIIPAIATTNAVIAGLIVFQALKVLANDWASVRTVFLQGKTQQPLQAYKMQKPAKGCGVCGDVYVPLACDTGKLTLGEVLEEVVKKDLGYGEGAKLSVYESGRVLAEPDYGDEDKDEGDEGMAGNLKRTLEDLGVGVGKWLTVVDEEDEKDRRANVVFAICAM